MSVRLYDEAIVNLIKSWTKDPNLVMLKPDEVSRLFQTRADQNDDKPLSLPLIAISRRPSIRILNTNRQPKSYDGFKLRAYNKNGEEVRFKSTFKLRAIPIEIGYQIDIYTAHLSTADDYSREFAFKLINKPTIKIEIPYENLKINHVSTIRMENEVEDNSDIPERAFPTQFTRFTLNLVIDDAYYFSVPDNENVAVVGFDVVSKETNEAGDVEVEVITESDIK